MERVHCARLGGGSEGTVLEVGRCVWGYIPTLLLPRWAVIGRRVIGLEAQGGCEG